jgi:hypothetical protein
MLYLRGQVRDYEEWAQITGDSRWNWDSVLPIFKQSEDYWGGADDMHGNRGEWRVEKQRLHWDILDRYTEAAQQAGIPFKSDYNRGDNFGIGHFEVNQKKGVRWNASKAMLRPVMHRPQPEGGDRSADRQAGDGGQGGARRRVQPRWCRPPRHGAHRDPAHRRRHRLADHPAALGHRPRQAVAEARRAAGS